MDLQGQRLCERLYTVIIVAFAVVAFLAGYLLQSFAAMLAVFGGGVGIAAVLCLPDWPMYNRHPIKWLPAKHKAPAAKKSGARKGDLAKRFWSLF